MSSTDSTTHTYAIDKSHSEVFFQVRHLITKVRGRFSDFTGTVTLNEAHPDQCHVDFTIQAASVDTSSTDRDTHLRSADFFHVEEHPTLTFHSTKVVKKSSEHFLITGNLTIRGVKKEVELPTTFLGHAKDPWGGARVGFEAELTVNRKDFGLVWNAALEAGGFLVGDDVHIHLSIQAVAQ
ncbi:MAG: YceI family protein [Vicinamibacterales bacterium]